MLAFGPLACGGGNPVVGRDKPPEICLSVEASSNLNMFDGEAHVVVLYFYPLQNAQAFTSSDPQELLGGERVPGTTGDAWEITVFPGATQELREKLPRDTEYVGVLADFYAGPSRTVVEADCGTFSQTAIVLSSSDVQAEE